MNEMYQVYVVTAKGNQRAVGPKFGEKQAAEQFIFSLRAAISNGRITGWHDPEIVTLIPEVQ